jgi:hypothetical protein
MSVCPASVEGMSGEGEGPDNGVGAWGVGAWGGGGW